MTHPNKNSGLSLVELLIAMTLGLILLSSMIAVFSGNKRSADLNTALSNIQENARFALSEMSRDIRMGGYQGCLDMRSGLLRVRASAPPINQVGVWADDGSPRYNFAGAATTGAVVLSENNWWPPIPGGFVPPAVNPAIPGTHALSLQFGSTNSSALTGQMRIGDTETESAPIVIDKNLGLAIGDLAIIANCDFADLFRVTSSELANQGQRLGHSAALNWSGVVTLPYGDRRTIRQTQVMKFVAHVYYIGDTGLTNDSGDPITALYQQSIPYNDPTNPPVELVQGVENMRISYGINVNGTIRYVTANDPSFIAGNVESIQIGLLMSSWDRIAEEKDNNTYLLAGQAITPAGAGGSTANRDTHPNDKRYRLVFNTTVKVRNRRL